MEPVELVDPADPSFLNTMSTGSFDVAFIALHGRGGEDGHDPARAGIHGHPLYGFVSPCERHRHGQGPFQAALSPRRPARSHRV